MVRLVYPVTDEDQRTAVRALVAAQPIVRWTRIAAVLIPVAMVAWSMSAGWSFGMALFRNIYWLVAGSLLLLFHVPFTVRSALRAVRRANPTWAEEQVVSFDEASIRMESASSRSEIPWSEVRRANESANVILLHFGAGRVLFVPRHVAASQGMLEPLRRLLRAKLGSAYSP